MHGSLGGNLISNFFNEAFSSAGALVYAQRIARITYGRPLVSGVFVRTVGARTRASTWFGSARRSSDGGRRRKKGILKSIKHFRLSIRLSPAWRSIFASACLRISPLLAISLSSVNAAEAVQRHQQTAHLSRMFFARALTPLTAYLERINAAARWVSYHGPRVFSSIRRARYQRTIRQNLHLWHGVDWRSAWRQTAHRGSGGRQHWHRGSRCTLHCALMPRGGTA
jgi:hypothetical protein